MIETQIVEDRQDNYRFTRIKKNGVYMASIVDKELAESYVRKLAGEK